MRSLGCWSARSASTASPAPHAPSWWSAVTETAAATEATSARPRPLTAAGAQRTSWLHELSRRTACSGLGGPGPAELKQDLRSTGQPQAGPDQVPDHGG